MDGCVQRFSTRGVFSTLIEVPNLRLVEGAKFTLFCLEVEDILVLAVDYTY